jgi:hypothetical protein
LTERIFAVDYDREHGDAGKFHVHLWEGDLQKRIATKADAEIAIGKDPLRLSKWFCGQANITHNETLASLPPVQANLFRI